MDTPPDEIDQTNFNEFSYFVDNVVSKYNTNTT